MDIGCLELDDIRGCGGKFTIESATFKNFKVGDYKHQIKEGLASNTRKLIG